jgi:hypothetical protein
VSIDDPIELSLAATDLLWEQLQLTSFPVLFELPSIGETIDDRARLREIVYQDLVSRGLAHRGRLDGALVASLAMLVRFGHAIEGVVMSDEPLLVFRAATDGRSAVLAVKRDQMIRFSSCRPDGLVHAVLTLIGDAKPGPGRSVSYPDAEAAPNPGGILVSARAAAGDYGPERRSAQEILNKPRTRSGWYGVLGRNRSAPQLVWFDTVDGRYVAHRRPGPDGRPWATCSPADRSRIGQLLAELVHNVASV